MKGVLAGVAGVGVVLGLLWWLERSMAAKNAKNLVLAARSGNLVSASNPQGATAPGIATAGAIEPTPTSVTPNDLAAPSFNPVELVNPIVQSPTPLTDSSASPAQMNYSPQVQTPADEQLLSGGTDLSESDIAWA